MRDGADNCITICNMENLDPMGVHTGDTIVVAPSQTLTDKEYQMLRSASLKIIRALGIEGGCNIQFALAPRKEIADWALRPDGRPPYYVIEVNPRVSRSSALASKATGYPIARVAAKIAVGKTLDEIPNRVTGKTTAAFEPALDYVVVKIPRWPFDKFPLGDRRTGTQMKATGEVMAIDRTFEAALEQGRPLPRVRRPLAPLGGPRLARHRPPATTSASRPTSASGRSSPPCAAAPRSTSCARLSGIDPWFLHKLQGIVAMEQRLLAEPLTPDLMREAKRLGFSDTRHRHPRPTACRSRCAPAAHRSGASAPSTRWWTPAPPSSRPKPRTSTAPTRTRTRRRPSPGEKALVIGSGPIRIGQGIEFDYSAVHAAWALQEAGVGAIMANSNPETVSTDFDTSDRLYFEPLDEEGVRDLLENESANGTRPRHPSSSSAARPRSTSPRRSPAPTTPILGSSAEAIDLAEDRRRFEDAPAAPRHPAAARRRRHHGRRGAADRRSSSATRSSSAPATCSAAAPWRSSRTPRDLMRYVAEAARRSPRASPSSSTSTSKASRPRSTPSATASRQRSSPASCSTSSAPASTPATPWPSTRPLGLTDDEIDTIVDYTQRMAGALGVKGLMNVQYVIMRPEGWTVTSATLRASTSSRSTRAPAAPSRSSRR